MKVNLRIESDTVSPELVRVLARLSTSHRADLHAVLGEHYARMLRAHFLLRSQEPRNPRFAASKAPRFYAQMRRATSLASADTRKAVVTVADSRFRAKVEGPTTIRPSGQISPATGKPIRNLSIPLRAESYGARPSEFGKKAFFILVSKSRKVFLAKRDPNGALRLYYRLVKSATIPADPRALPPRAQMIRELRAHALDWVEGAGISLK